MFRLTASMIVGLIAACGSAHAASNKLQRVFQYDMLNTRIAYFESVTGPAMRVFSTGSLESREYRIDGCKVMAGADNSNIRWLRLDLSQRCNFNLGSFIGHGYPSTAGMTVGKFGKQAFGPDLRVQATCISLCGNAANPEVDFTWEGPHAANFLNVTLSVLLVSQPALNGVSRWEQVIRRRENENYIVNTRFNCERRFDVEGVRAFADAPVTAVTIGYDLPASDYEKRCQRR